jgi:hypothetical protein
MEILNHTPIQCDGALSEEFQRVKTTYSADKTALAAALKGGAQIEGVALIERRSWSIK